MQTIQDDDILSLKLSWGGWPIPESFSLLTKLGNDAIGKAHGTYEEFKEFRLTKIDVFDPHKGKGYGTIMIYSLIGAAKTKNAPSSFLKEFQIQMLVLSDFTKNTALRNVNQNFVMTRQTMKFCFSYLLSLTPNPSIKRDTLKRAPYFKR